MTARVSSFDLLAWLPDDAREALLGAATVRRYAPRQVIYAQSDPGDEMFRVAHGSVRLSVMQPDGRELLYKLCQEGDCFGTSSVVDGEPRPQTAEAHENATLQVFGKATLDALRWRHFALNDAMLRLLSRHMRLVSDYYAGLAFDAVPQRLAQRLIDLVEAFGEPAGSGVALATPLSQSELALMAGTTRQSVNACLQDFRGFGLIATSGARLTVTNVAGLRAVADKGWRLRRFLPARNSTNAEVMR